jgi:hypothetical protein
MLGKRISARKELVNVSRKFYSGGVSFGKTVARKNEVFDGFLRQDCEFGQLLLMIETAGGRGLHFFEKMQLYSKADGFIFPQPTVSLVLLWCKEIENHYNRKC